MIPIIVKNIIIVKFEIKFSEYSTTNNVPLKGIHFYLINLTFFHFGLS